ncbi:PREDICTED: MYB-like transcription factor ETC3 isoform X1 [Camelina sativa]|uniref:MYB-like transcription factor ETC3 isoform X1 n=1 Tax=Camelina sativa TaxID=90675 RepID=A0ABM0TKS2_CAMSA|nr:PREDICTED: MYB-like transcription factor ETC3 isoform X1 [Camelina sativa]
MDNHRRTKQAKTNSIVTSSSSEEVSSLEWEIVNMNQEEEDLVCRMHKLVGDRWELIAGRIPGRTAEEIEKFWVMKTEK